jgi:Tol biopolymer transport system component
MWGAWTPDSKGFYFTGGKDYKKLLYLDVAAKKARVLVADFKGMTHWPAVSPDGKRVAVVTSVRDDQKYGIQVVVYDSAGKAGQSHLRFMIP